jgi:murein L,D-transpeptidase YcbB/YkuD
MKLPPRALGRLFLAASAWIGAVGGFQLLGAEPPAAKEPAVSKELATSAAPMVAPLKLSEGRQKRLMSDLQALYAGAAGPVWPAELSAQVATPAGLKAAAELLFSHGFLPAELAWLEKVPQESPDLHTSIVVLYARQLLGDGPAGFDALWPKWDQGSPQGTAENAVASARGDLPAYAATAPADVVEVLQAFVPKNPVYALLQKNFANTRSHLEALRAEFIPIPGIKQGSALKPGDPYKDAPILAKRLSEEGYLPVTPVPAGSTYTLGMSLAVRRFQEDHGRTADGIIGPNTLTELNRSPDAELALLRINLHRARLLPDDLGERFVMVNIPSAQVLAFADVEKPAVVLRAIVGAAVKERQTPIFHDVMERIEFGPYWNVPPTIAQKEILPKLRKDRSYLERNNYEIVADYQATKAQPVNAETLSQVAAAKMFIRQKPGPKNALGRVKFLFPNDFSIYLHDTPEGQLFAEAERGFSHGCIRVENPAALAEFVLGSQGWDRARVEMALKTTEMQKVVIEQPLNVYIVYFTAFPNWDPADPRPVRFHPDIYHRDPRLLASTKERTAKEP